MKLKAEDILFIIFFSLAVIFFLWYLFGGSPTLEQALLVLIMGFITRLHGEIKELKGSLEGIKSRLDMLWDDFKKRKKI